MLANIKYAMRKNKSTPITMRGLNLSCMLNDGDVVDSKNISLRKYPYITTGKRDTVDIDSGEVGSMAVFQDQLVTKKKKLQYAAVNTKLTMFPDRTYQDEDGMVKNLFCSSESNFTVFSNNAILGKTAAAQDENIHEGYGIVVSEKAIAFQKTSVVSKAGRKYCVGQTGDLKTLLGVVNATNPTEVSHFEIEENKLMFSGTQESTGLTSKGDVFYLNCPEGYEEYSNFYEIGDVQLYETSTPPYFVAEVQRYGDQSKDVVFSMEGSITMQAYKTTSDQLIGARERIISIGNKECVIASVSNDDRNMYYLSDRGQPISNGMYDSVSMLGWDSLWEDGVFSPPFSEGETITVIAPTVGRSISATVDGSLRDTVTLQTSVSPMRVPFTDKVYILKGEVEGFDNEPIQKGDVVEVSGCEIDGQEANNTYFKIDQIKDGVIYAAADIFTPGVSTSPVAISRNIPQLDFVCEKDNRLYGCSNADKTIYVSALGDPTNMYDYDGISTDSFAVAVGSEGDFTGCCKYGSSVLFFKENKIYKLMGSYPAEYSLYSYDVDGVEAGSENSIVTINEVLYYKAKRGIFAYTGDVPSLISASFGEKRFHSAAAGTDGESYFVSMKDDKDQSYLFSYNTRLGIWMMEGNEDISQFVRQGNDVKALSGGNVYAFRAEEDPNVEWHLQFAPIYETMEGKKIYSRIMMRAEIPRGSYMKIKIRCDGGAWLEAGTVVGKMADVVPIMIPINRCDKFELRLEGKGPCTILSMQREFYVSGSNK